MVQEEFVPLACLIFFLKLSTAMRKYNYRTPFKMCGSSPQKSAWIVCKHGAVYRM